MIRFIQKNIVHLFLGIILFADLSFSYVQYSRTPLDGDFSAIVIAEGNNGYVRVLNDPFGWAALKGEVYAAPNRFTAHYVMSVYFKHFPLFLQKFMSPIDSLYTSIAITKLFIHICLLFLIAYFISMWNGFQWRTMLQAVVLISPLFHAGGNYVEYMAVIDPSITYTMFYALPMVAVLLFYLTFYRCYVTKRTPDSLLFLALWLALSVFIVFFGALPAPIIIISAVLLTYGFVKTNLTFSNESCFNSLLNAIFKVDKILFSILLFATLCSIYSLYIGTKNSENDWWPMPLIERYKLLPTGIYEAFFNRSNGILYLLMAIVFNLIALYVLLKEKYSSFFKLSFYLLIFCIVYLLLLPLGGYREYRPFILRRDTLIPILIILFYMWGMSSLFLLSYFQRIIKWIYLCFLCGVIIYYTKKDRMPIYTNNLEKEALHAIANADENCVLLNRACTVMGWTYFANCEESVNNCVLLEYYNIIPKGKRYTYTEK